MKTIIFILFLLTSVLASDSLDSKIKEYCKNEASEYTGQSFIDFIYKTCYKECKEERLTLEQLNKKIKAKAIKNKAKAERETAQKQERVEQKAKIEQNKQIMKLPTGNWGIRYFVDRFGEKTNKAYITNDKRIRGVFSNSATRNSKLDVIFIIASPTNIAIKLFEYARNNPVREKSYTYNDFNVYAKDKNGESITHESHYSDGRKVNVIMRANLKDDKLVFDSESVSALHNGLLKGGKIRFNIEKASNGPLPEYSFILDNANYYNNAIKKISVINNGY